MSLQKVLASLTLPLVILLSCAPVPAQSTIPAPVPATAPLTKSPKKLPKSTTVVVNVNTATLAELQQVKGIGAATANKIVAGRPYKSLDELTSKNALSAKQFEKFKAQLSIRAL
ncbi:ComEA family DNA-binding protein [Anthocerotibacter panamensis]|uniref:ComEA family DNA-binding protein n=1 Tax=Anthocerotibacter panamensis TaxID=2857077 RepID=UPI001C406C3C|nr:helix-hairpin-helix domain-containing protein [Anthocerotibacter panamensis]